MPKGTSRMGNRLPFWGVWMRSSKASMRCCRQAWSRGSSCDLWMAAEASAAPTAARLGAAERSEEHTSELQSLMRISYAVFCLKKKKTTTTYSIIYNHSIYKYNNKQVHLT